MRNWIFLIVLILGGGYVYRITAESRHERELAAERIRKAEEHQKRIDSELKNLEAREDHHEQSRDAQIKALRAKIFARQTIITDLSDEIVRRKNAGIDRAANVNIQDRLEKEKSVLMEIDREIKEVETTGKISETAIQQNRVQAKAIWQRNHDDQDDQNRALLKKMTDQNSEISELKKRRFDFEAKRKISDLKTVVDTEKVSLVDGREQLKRIDRDWKNSSANLSVGTHESKVETTEAIQDLRARRAAEAAKLDALNHELAGVKKEEGGEVKNLSDLEKDRANAQREVDLLLTELGVLEKN
jgi:hypothetical protein